MKDFTYEQALFHANSYRRETINQLTYLIEGLQHDLNRLEKFHDDEAREFSEHDYSLGQHCLRYEQTVKAGAKMEAAARIVDWLQHMTKYESTWRIVKGEA